VLMTHSWRGRLVAGPFISSAMVAPDVAARAARVATEPQRSWKWRFLARRRHWTS
jgi:hypothetical protein